MFDRLGVAKILLQMEFGLMVCFEMQDCSNTWRN